MELKQALKIAEAYQDWRLGKVQQMPYSPGEFTQALEAMMEVIRHKIWFNDLMSLRHRKKPDQDS